MRSSLLLSDVLQYRVGQNKNKQISSFLKYFPFHYLLFNNPGSFGVKLKIMGQNYRE